MPLIYAQTGEENIITRISGNPQVKRRLEDMGFVVGASVTVVNTLNGNLIVNVKNVRVAIDRKIASKIMI